MQIQSQKNKVWTIEDDNLLIELYGNIELEEIAVRLRRNKQDCYRRHRKLMGSAAIEFSNGYLTTGQLADCIGVTRRTIHGWIVNHKLPYVKLTAGKRLINPAKFWKWVAARKVKINFLKYKKGSICPEPKWVLQEIKAARAVLQSRKNERWTVHEENLLMLLVSSGHTVKEISIRLNRSAGGVKYKKHMLKNQK